MNNQDKTKEKLIQELEELKQKHDALRISYESAVIEKNKAMDALQTSEENYHLIADNVTDVVWITDLKMNPTYISPSVERVYGIKPEDYLTLPLTGTYPPTSLNKFQKVLTEEFAKEQNPETDKNRVFEMEAERYHADGTIGWDSISARFLRDEQNNPIAIQGVSRDITKRKQSEDALRNSQERFRIAQEMSPDGFTILRPLRDNNNQIIDFTWVYQNPAVAKMNGTDPEEIVGKRLLEVFPGHQGTPLLKTYRQVAESGEACIFETVYSGESIKKPTSFRIVVVPMKEDIAILAQDITERKQAEQSMAESEEYLSITLNSIGDAVISTDINGGIVSMNPVAQKLCGWKLSDALGKPLPEVFRIINAHSRQTVANPVEKVLKNGEIIGLANHTVLLSKDGKEYQIADSAAPIKNKKGDILGIVLVFSDVTEKYIAEKRIKESEERFQLAMNASKDGLWDWNLQTNEIYYSPAWKKMLGYEDDELPNDFSVWENTTEPEDVRKSWELQQKLINGQIEQFSVDFKMKHKLGHWVHVLSRAKAVFDDKGKAIRMVGTHTDITQRKQAEAEKIKQKKIMAHAEELAGIGSWEWDIINDTWQLSENWIKIHGLVNSPISFSPINSSQLISIAHPEDKPAIEKAFTRAIELGEPYDIEHRIIRQDTGEIRHVYAKGIIVADDFGKPKALVGAAQDITELRQTEKALRQREEMMLTSQSVAHICSYSTNLDLNELDKSSWVCSPEFYKIFGIDESYPHTIEGWTNFIHPDYRDEIVAYHKSVVKEKKSFNREYKIIRINDGAERWVHGTGELEFNKNGEPVRMHGAIQDITGRKQTDENVKKNQELLQIISDNMFDLVALTDLEGNFTFAGASHKILGFEIEKLIATNVMEYVHPDDLPYVMAAFKEFLNNKEDNKKVIYRNRCANGSYLWLETVGRFICDEKGTPRQILFNSRDITDRRKAYEALRESEESFRMLAELAPVGIIITDESQNPAFASPAFTKIFGYTIQDIPTVGHWFLLAYPDENLRNRVKQEWFVFIETVKSGRGAGKTLEYPVFCKNGHVKQIEFRIAISGNIHVIIFTDITERKMAEEVRKELEIAHKTAQFKQNFLANMSHEIRTPLTGVLGMIEVMEQTPLSQDQKDYLHTIKVSGENLREIINQVLDYSKIEAGKLTIHKGVFEFASIPISAVSLYKNKVKAGVKFTNVIDPNIPIWMEADNGRLSQILNNLVSNAVKFTAKGAIIIQSILVSSQPQSGQVRIKVEVRDTGPGIPKDLQGKLFIPFSQVEVLDTRNFEGTGLGLSICKQLVEMMKGEIGVISEEGKGSTFWFTFLAKTAHKPHLAVPVKSVVEIKKLHILLAEDKIVNQKVIKLLLTSMGHEVAIANNGQEAIDFYQPGQFDLILMDIQMPVMNGIAATKKLKEKYKNLPPIVGLSANAFEGDRQKYMAMGMDDYLTKPVKKGDLEKLIRKMFSQTQNPNPQSG